MAYFRILVGLRGCYVDSSENEVHEIADAAELRALIADKVEWYTDHIDSESDINRCSLAKAEELFKAYTAPRAPYLPTCAASWENDTTGVLVSGATEAECAESELQGCEHFTATSGNVYFLAPSTLASWVEYGAGGVSAKAECAAYMAQAVNAYDIPAGGVIVNASTDATWAHESLYAFTMPNGLTYRGAATVLAYIPALGA